LKRPPHFSGEFSLCLIDLGEIQLGLNRCRHAEVIVQTERSIGAPPKRNEPFSGLGKEPASTFENVDTSIHGEAVPVTSTVTGENVGKILAKINPWQRYRIHPAVRLRALPDSRRSVA